MPTGLTPPATARSSEPPSGRGYLVAVEGPDGAGKTALVELLARWLERRDRDPRIVSWKRSPTVTAASADRSVRPALTPTVAALLAAADAARRADEKVRPVLAAGRPVLADRYAWTGVAREIARGLDPTWAGALYRPLPPPDLVIYVRQDPSVAVERALAGRPDSAGLGAVNAAFGGFLERLVAAFDGLAADPAAGPWPTTVVELAAARPTEHLWREARTAIRERIPGAID